MHPFHRQNGEVGPGFPKGGLASYEGDTVAIQNTTVLTGTARVDVIWNDPIKVADLGGTMTMTIGNLANTNGDPLTYGGAKTTRGKEIADIVFSGIAIKTGEIPNAGHLIAGKRMDTGKKGADNKSIFTYDEVGVNDVRYRFAAANELDQKASNTAGSVKALFVGQGVDGPLGVIGTWSLTDKMVGRENAAGSGVDDQEKAIFGAFGAELP